MSERTVLAGAYRIANKASLHKRMESLNGDPRLQFYQALLATDNYETYLAAVGRTEVSVPSYRQGPISGRHEILYARRRGWIGDAGGTSQVKSSASPAKAKTAVVGKVVAKPSKTVPPPNFERGRTYNRRADIHAVYGGQQQGGIATPAGPFIFLFTGQQGAAYGYHDGMRPDGIFEYTGEGQTGEMEFVRGNKAIRDHAENGKDLLLFETLKTKGQCRYLGSFVCDSWEPRASKDKDGSIRQVIVFHLVPFENVEAVELDTPKVPDPKVSLEDLRRQAYASAGIGGTSPGKGQRNVYVRSRDVRDYVLARAKGNCEACKLPAPFKRSNGSPYLEPHHTRRLSDGGPDHPRWVGAICPTCHRHIHHGENGVLLNDALQIHLGQVEPKDPPKGAGQ